jgi:hypothetical protein
MTTPLPEASSCARLTLLPGESSKRSVLGIESPCLTWTRVSAGQQEDVLGDGSEMVLYAP